MCHGRTTIGRGLLTRWLYHFLRTIALLGLLLVSSFGWAQPSDSLLIVRPHFRVRAIHAPSILPHRELRRPVVGVVLSGGGARGIAHIGILKVLERSNIPIDFIAATSMGAVVGGLYAAGNSPHELESLAVTTNWDEVLALTDEKERRNLSFEKKLQDDRSFLAVRFEGLEPVFPQAVSSGQRLTDFLNRRILQSVYQPYPDFDHMRIRFRAVATDLVSGRQVILRDGSLGEALRATSTVPLLFNPVEIDNMQLVDGGLLRNIPVDVARSEGCDITVAVNTTSELRSVDEMKAPWQTADQIMGIMMAAPNEEQLRKADIVITPEVGGHLSSDFHGLDTLIAAGERAGEQAVAAIRALYERTLNEMTDPQEKLRAFPGCLVERATDQIPDSLWLTLGLPERCDILSVREIRSAVETLYETEMFEDVWAEVHPSARPVRIVFKGKLNPVLTSVQLEGCRRIPRDSVQMIFRPNLHKVITHSEGDRALEGVIRKYRARGFSLARFDSIQFDRSSGVLRLVVDEGEVGGLDVQGGVRTQDPFVLREFAVKPGDIFELEKVQQGINNLSGTTLFEWVYLEVMFKERKPFLMIRLKERPSQLVRLGIRVDNERHLQGLVDIRDENFRGTGTELGLTVALGERNSDVIVEYNARRLFDTDLTFGVRALHKVVDSYVFDDAPPPGENRWERIVVGEYRDIRYGGGISIGSLLERLGNASAELIFQKVQLVSIENAEELEERYNLALVRLGTTVDTKNLYPFPTSGIGLSLSYEFALEGLGSDVSYNALSTIYESYTTWGKFITFHPRFTVGFADKTMPLSQQFRLGGRELFYGLREDDRRGRQLLLMNVEFRAKSPVRLLFDTYIRARYDLGTISSVPEEIKLSTFMHGIGVELALTTPVGPAIFGLGKSFYFSSDIPEPTTQWGPLLLYFTIGYQL